MPEPTSGGWNPSIRDQEGRREILDPVRQKWVALTPEEGVRQRLLALLFSLGYPTGLLAVEKKVEHLGRLWRADVVAYDRRQRPALLAECKAPGVAVEQATFDQLARYNAVLGARALLATNGDDLRVCTQDASGLWRWVGGVPRFEDLNALPEAP
ncbi:MAG: type I restriction enzyme HsdR N-terminal domain-containing protein [Bacteroidota bacterium]